MPSKSTTSRKSKVPKAPAKKGSANCEEYTQKNLDDALAACDPHNPDRISANKAQVLYGVPKTTILNHLRGKLNYSKAHVNEQALSPEEEAALANYCKLRGYRGVPLGKQEIIRLASDISGRTIGKNWIYAFEKCHPELKFRWARRGEAKRASGLNHHNVDSYFKDLEHIMATHNILPKDIYNLDEKGLEQLGGDLRMRVLVDQAQREPKLHGEEGRQMATVLECVSAGGFAIPPLLIHPGAEKDGEWIRDNPCNAYLAASPNGWTDADIGVEWIKVFNEETLPLMEGSNARLLIVDGHNSHTTLAFLLYAERNGIIVLCLPPHTTPKLQPLDVGVFNFLAKAWSKEVSEAGQAGYKITKFNLLSYYAKARDAAFTPEIIRSAFKHCGIWPLNRQVIKEEDLAPADNVTMYSSQPLPATLPPFLELIPVNSSEPCPPQPPLHPISPHSLGITQPLQHTATVRQLDRPAPPPQRASKKELRGVITALNSQLDRANSQMRCNYAQMVLMDKENGDIRKRLYRKTTNGRKVTHIKDGSRILTSRNGIDKLAQEHHKRVVATILKEAGPIFRSRFKQLEAREKELQKKFEDDERRKLKGAESTLKESEKQMDAATKRKNRVEVYLKNAKAKIATSTTRSVVSKAEKDCEKYEAELEELTHTITRLEPLLVTAESTFERISKAHAARLPAAENAEKRYQQAIELEKKQKEVLDAREQAEVARKAKLRRRLPNPANTWKTRFQEEKIDEPLTKFDQESVVYSGVGPRLPSGSFMVQGQVADTRNAEIFEIFRENEDFDEDLVDPALISESRLMSQCRSQVYKMQL